MAFETAGATVLRYFNPTRSPFYPIVAFGSTAVVLSCSGIEHRLWYFVVIPIFLAVTIALGFAFNSRPTLSADEHHEQLIFARSLSISTALVAFALTARGTDRYPLQFWLTCAACVTQVLVFLTYILARSRSRDPLNRNFVQLALITTILLITFCRSLYLYSIHKGGEGEGDVTNPEQYLYAAYGMGVLWLFCIAFWITYLIRIMVHVPVDPELVGTPSSSETKATAGSGGIPD